MISEQTDALILRVYPWSETSCVVSLYTRNYGKTSVLAKGAWRARSPFEGALDLLSTCRVVFIPKPGDALGLLTEAKLQRRFRPASRELIRLYCGYYVSETLDRLTEKDQSQPELYELASSTLEALSMKEMEPRAIVLRWELQLLRLLGHLPTLDRCTQCETSLPNAEAVLYAPVAGGVICPSCAQGLRPLIQLPTSARGELLRFSAGDWRVASLEYFALGGRAAVRGAMERTFAALLERRFNLTPFLQELGH